MAFENDGDESLDLTGYTIRDPNGTAFDVPDGFTLDGGRQVRLHTGTGGRTGTVLEYSYPRG